MKNVLWGEAVLIFFWELATQWDKIRNKKCLADKTESFLFEIFSYKSQICRWIFDLKGNQSKPFLLKYLLIHWIYERRTKFKELFVSIITKKWTSKKQMRILMPLMNFVYSSFLHHSLNGSKMSTIYATDNITSKRFLHHDCKKGSTQSPFWFIFSL